MRLSYTTLFDRIILITMQFVKNAHHFDKNRRQNG